MKSRLGHSFVSRLLPALGYPLIALIALSSSAASSAEPDATQPADSPSLSMAAVPTATYGSDEGFGTGGVASFYLHEPGVLPYKAALTLNVFITSRLIQRHRIRVDVLSVAGLPLRIYGQVGYDSTITQNFCGYGNAVTCDPKVADEVARNAGQTPETDTYQAIQQRHYLMRFIRPYAEGIVRYALSAKPHRLELWGGWRGNYYIPGELRWDAVTAPPRFIAGPFPFSSWEQQAPEGEPGFSSVLQLGVAIDDRDEETQPNRGYFVEASLRGAHGILGSRWQWLGAQSSVALYTPLVWGTSTAGADWVLAQRVVFDGILGDAPTEDLARLGGLTDFIAFGGSDIGRGIREHRYLGKIKLITQQELRWSFSEFEVWQQHLKWGLAGFLDAAWLGYDLFDWRGDTLGIVAGGGLGLRLLWNQNFTVRFDVGFSPTEQYEPRVYIRVGNPF